jgi:hypothetical protein
VVRRVAALGSFPSAPFSVSKKALGDVVADVREVLAAAVLHDEARADESTKAAESSGFFTLRRRFCWRSGLAFPDILLDRSRLPRNAR